MYISRDILKDFLTLPKNLEVKEIAERLTKHTVEVEDFFYQGEKYAGVIVAKVLSVEKHPNADKLRLAEVDIKTEKLRIVCGASNLEKGQLVPVATIGTVLPGDFLIKESEIRGEKSSGMICAEDELGLGDDHEGIMVLDKTAKVGEKFSDYLKLNDIVLEIDNKSLSNRPDLLNHYGIAREISAIFDLKLKDYQSFIDSVSFSNEAEDLKIKIEAKENCHRYTAIKIDNVKISESPVWLKNRLLAIGQKPINNIVDLTNYVMFEMGQPLHAFDASKVKNILVRQALKNEKIETLDGKNRILDEEDLLITDGQKPLAIAGVMGGKESGVSFDTSSIILEAANFQAHTIRKTSQKLNLRSESSLRFEKSLDPEMTILALKRFCVLLKEICPDLVFSSKLFDKYIKEQEKIELKLSFSWLNNKIGQEIEQNKIINYLEKLGFEIKDKEEDFFTVIVPSWRASKDVKQKEDILEEVLRLFGYDNIESSLPLEKLSLPEINKERLLERKIKEVLSLKHSLFEVYNYSFVGEDQLKKMGIDFLNHLKLANPLSENHSILRQSLVPNMSLNIKNNQAKASSLRLFEIGRVFFKNPGNLDRGNKDKNPLPYQENKIAIALANDKNLAFSEMKGIVESLLKNIINFQVEAEFSVSESFPAWSDENLLVTIFVFGKKIGFIGKLKDETLNNLGLKKKIVFAELDFNVIFDIFENKSDKSFEDLAKYPAVERDMAFVINKEIKYNEIRKEIINFSDLIKKVELFDVYEGDKLESDKRSLAFHISLLSKEKTLSSIEVDEIQNKLIEFLGNKFEAKLRDF